MFLESYKNAVTEKMNAFFYPTLLLSYLTQMPWLHHL